MSKSAVTPIDDDDYVAALLASEARERSIQYSAYGLSALLPKRAANKAPKPNTRFLRNIVQEADSHNAALKAKEERERLRVLDKFERKREGRLSGSRSRTRSRSASEERRRGRRRRDKEERHSRRHRDRDKERERGRGDEGEDSDRDRRKRRRRRSRSRSRSKSRSRSRSVSVEREGSRHKRRGRERSRSPGEGRERSRDRDRDRDRGQDRDRHRSRRHRSSSRRHHGKSSRRSKSRNRGRERSRDRRDWHRPSRKKAEQDNSPKELSNTPEPSPVHKNGREGTSPRRTGDPDPDSPYSSDPLDDIIGPRPPPPAPTTRGRGKITTEPGTSAMDSRFNDKDYDPSTDIQPEALSSISTNNPNENWDEALEAFRTRQKWKALGAERLRSAGFTEEFVKAWETNGVKDEGKIQWTKKGGVREWDRGKVVEEGGEIVLKAPW
ncbi:hypothetical protein BDZ91DRAFT_732524 [Kalaharituber pfeilii]|nr:hypothetical protein BDZ91DRAFT_732524 [Kalaharituber pfeilii]